MLPAAILLLLLVLSISVQGQTFDDLRKNQPLFIKPGQLAKVAWKPSTQHPDVVMCCGGAVQLSWSLMEGGSVASVVVNIDDSCPNELLNQQYVQYLYQASNKGLVTLDFKQNGDYYISNTVADYCQVAGQQFLLAVRDCPTDNPVYPPVRSINAQCMSPQQQLAASNATAALNTPAAAGGSSVSEGAGAAAMPGMTQNNAGWETGGSNLLLMLALVVLALAAML